MCVSIYNCLITFRRRLIRLMKQSLKSEKLTIARTCIQFVAYKRRQLDVGVCENASKQLVRNSHLGSLSAVWP